MLSRRFNGTGYVSQGLRKLPNGSMTQLGPIAASQLGGSETVLTPSSDPFPSRRPSASRSACISPSSLFLLNLRSLVLSSQLSLLSITTIFIYPLHSLLAYLNRCAISSRPNSSLPFLSFTMFFKKSTLALAFVALASIVSAGQTPACIIEVMGYVDASLVPLMPPRSRR